MEAHTCFRTGVHVPTLILRLTVAMIRTQFLIPLAVNTSFTCELRVSLHILKPHLQSTECMLYIMVPTLIKVLISNHTICCQKRMSSDLSRIVSNHQQSMQRGMCLELQQFRSEWNGLPNIFCSGLYRFLCANGTWCPWRPTLQLTVYRNGWCSISSSSGEDISPSDRHTETER